MTQNDKYTVLLEVIRGKKPWSVLQQYFAISFYDGRWQFGANMIPPMRISASDVAEGLINLLTKPPVLRDWASFMLAASSLIDLEEIENYDELLEALWDASFGNTIKKEAISFSRKLLK